MLIRLLVVWMLAAGLTILGARGASAQNYPNKPIRIVTAGSGGPGDFVSRIIAQGISGPLGQPVIVDNRGSAIMAQVASEAPPDGYTLLITGPNFWISPLLQKASYDPVRDFAPIAILVTTPFLIVVHPSLPVKTVKELITLAKARPGELNYSYGGFGGASHIAAELFKATANVKIQGVNYKSDAQQISDLIGGYVQVSFEGQAKVGTLIKSGQLRALAVCSLRPSLLAPGLPTAAASGLPGFEAASLTGAFAPIKTPTAIISRLNQEMVRFLNTTDAKERFLSSGVEPLGSSPEELAQKVQSDMTKTAKVLRDAGIKVE